MDDVSVLYEEFWCSHVLSFIVHIGLSSLSIGNFFQIVLCLNMMKINYPVSDSQSLNQYRLLNLVEMNLLLASPESTLCGTWCLLRHCTPHGTPIWPATQLPCLPLLHDQLFELPDVLGWVCFVTLMPNYWDFHGPCGCSSYLMGKIPTLPCSWVPGVDHSILILVLKGSLGSALGPGVWMLPKYLRGERGLTYIQSPLHSAIHHPTRRNGWYIQLNNFLLNFLLCVWVFCLHAWMCTTVESQKCCAHSYALEKPGMLNSKASFKGKRCWTHPPPGMLGMDVVYNLVIRCYLMNQTLPVSSRNYSLSQTLSP